ncbi:testis-expressed protein 52 [Sphaerodactylus townsendi]|uniref:testis-expressed protein 52 n=1 Tax=Sphaerodactylus townsendi TaxID=933632 RepID=UPI0020271544|nr:testis-expressed protein 52 [Sphaerodactylus townsendi]
MTTWKEMHFLHKDKNISWPGFSPRPYHKLAFEKPPCTDAKIMVSQKMRCPAEESARWHIWGYHTWLDVGRLPPIYRPRPDKPFDSNTWRWITAPRAGAMAEPPVPPPSHLDGNTYIRFIEGEALFVSQRHKERVLTRTKKEMKQCEQLKLRSECRAPPLDTEGNIMPPKEFKRYKRALSRKSPASCVQPEAVMPPSRDFWDHPCPSLEPHYQEAAVKFALKNSSLIYQEVVEKYQQLFLSGSKIRPCTPTS